jgi:chromosome partitioning protein
LTDFDRGTGRFLEACDLVLSDRLLVPFLPPSVDVWALADIAALVDEARAVRDGLAA